MTTHRLIQALTEFDASEMQCVFGDEERLLLSSTAATNIAAVERVAIFTEAFLPKIDGVSKSAYLTLRYLQQSGREVLVFAPDIAPTTVGSSRVVPMRSFGLPFAPETRVALPNLSIGKQLERFRPDLIHLFSPALMGHSAMSAARRQGIPIVANYQTDLPGYVKTHYKMQFMSPILRNWLRFIHNRCHLNLVGSRTTLDQLRREGYRRLYHWRRGVDTHRFNPSNRSAAWREKLLNERDPNALLCIYVGRLAPEKRVDLLLEVAQLPGVALTIIGDGAARDNLERLFAGTNTYFTGYLYGEDLSHAYASADVFVFGGTNETFGQVVQEAMASGLPTVIVNKGGIVDLVKDGHNGFVVNESPKAFAQAIRSLQANAALRQRMATNSRQMAAQHPWQSIMQQLEGYYQRAVDLNNRYLRLRDRSTISRILDPVSIGN